MPDWMDHHITHDEMDPVDMTDREMWREAANEVMRLEGIIRVQRQELEAYRSAARYDAGTFMGWDHARLDRARAISQASLDVFGDE